MSRLPPPGGPQELRGLSIVSYSVGSWCPTQDGSGPTTAVALSLEIDGLASVPVTMVMRLKTPTAVDTMIQSLLRHKRDVWPDAP